MREINRIIVHCSNSAWGCAAVIDKWHRERGWDSGGYHHVIPNGKPFATTDIYQQQWDGILEKGRPIETQGAHVLGYNEDSIGICLIGSGDGLYTMRQGEALRLLLRSLMFSFNVEQNRLYGHRDFNPKKTCPGFDVRSWL